MKIGIDIVEVERIEKLKNIDKIFFKSEIEYAEKSVLKYEHLAGFYCAKEAVIKALEGGSVQEVEICHKQSGAPYIVLHGKTKQLSSSNEIQISISHIKKLATAICTILS